MENNIGKLNAIFTQNIANLFAKKDGGKIIREYSLLIMNNKHLLKEYKIFNFIVFFNILPYGFNILI